MQVELTIPESWADITIDELSRCNMNDTKELIKCFCHTDEATADYLTMESITDILSMMKFVFQLPKPVYKEEITGKSGIVYSVMKDVNSLTVGELEELESLCMNFAQNVCKIAAWLYRADNTNRKDRAIDLADMTVEEIYGVCIFCLVTAGLLENDEIIKVFNG